MKVIAVCMGHYSADFTKKVYVKEPMIVYDILNEIMPFTNEILPNVDPNILEFTLDSHFLLDVIP